jgi:hypothetical protein
MVSGRQAAIRIGAPYRSMMRWVEEGVVEVEGHLGIRGERWHISPKALRELGVLSHLRRCGFSLQELRKVMDYLRSLGYNPFSSGTFLVVEGEEKDLFRVLEHGETLSLNKSRGQMVIVPLFEELDDG